MQYCNYCKVQIRGNKKKCPLCSNVLPSETKMKDKINIFPLIPPAFERHLAMRIMIFISISSIIASFAVYKIFPTNVNWPMLVLFGIISMWLSLIVVIRKRYNIAKNIMWQVTIVSVLSVFWDWRTGWRGWSLDFIIPIVCVVAMFVMYVTAKIMKLSIRDYVVYLLLDGLFGIIPIMFILFDWINIYYPSIICVTLSAIFLLAIIIFHGENIKSELHKRMHT